MEEYSTSIGDPNRRVARPWPAVLNGNIDVDRIHAAGFELYVVETPAASVSTAVSLFAIDWRSGRAYFYGTTE
jgi:hypothetical protein